MQFLYHLILLKNEKLDSDRFSWEDIMNIHIYTHTHKHNTHVRVLHMMGGGGEAVELWSKLEDKVQTEVPKVQQSAE